MLALMLVPATKAQPERIRGPIDASQTVELKGHISPRLAVGQDQGAVPGDLAIGPMTLVLSRSAAQQADLEALLAAQQQPGSPLYRQWLTPEQFADRFGMSGSDLAKITAWLQSQGLTVDKVARSRNWVRFRGPAARLSAALGTEVHYFDIGGERHYANTSAPRLPAAIQSVALGLEGLTDFRPKPIGHTPAAPAVAVKTASPRAAASCDPAKQTVDSGPLNPFNFGKIYDIPASAMVANQKIAVVGEVDTSSTSLLNDVNNFRTYFDLAATTVLVVAPDNESGFPPAFPK